MVSGTERSSGGGIMVGQQKRRTGKWFLYALFTSR
jgi:hypothetical protein